MKTTIDLAQEKVQRLTTTYRRLIRSGQPFHAVARCDEALHTLLLVLHDKHLAVALDLLIKKARIRFGSDRVALASAVRANALEVARKEAGLLRVHTVSKRAISSDLDELHDLLATYTRIDREEHLYQILEEVTGIGELREWISGRHDRILRGIQQARAYDVNDKKHLKKVILRRIEVTGRGLISLISNAGQGEELGSYSFGIGMMNLSRRLQDMTARRIHPEPPQPLYDLVYKY